MPDNNNVDLLDFCISEYKSNNELPGQDSEIFELFTATQLTKQYDLSHEDIVSSVVDGGQDGGIDCFLILVNDRAVSVADGLDDSEFSRTTTVNVFIIQAKTEAAFKEGTLDKLITSIPLVYDLEFKEQQLVQRFNPSLVEKVLIFRQAWKMAARKGSKISISYAYACKANEIDTSKAYKSKADQIRQCTEKAVRDAAVSVRDYSALELLRLYSKAKPTNLDIQCKQNPLPITFRKGQIGYLAVATLGNFYQFLRDEDGNVRESIFENNIRHWHGQVDVNNRIRETLEADYDRDFWWLNNGITIIASSVRQMGRDLTLDDVQVVNGL